ncbi:hypothetical protein FB554_0532 [Barrientosiimonas humi]|uniref:Ribosomal L7/L12-like protein n=1 Tax=Barrientosiimonas humi TaxID=999931 RepID=A0A542X987_9MICO|nr:hypothetical protein [Barrientosiimonas humi]TQL32407.1 hypothetical protein FB554_0532 [Barrientosiimonas humi]CAG7572398.1 hypothetical protein BH39T_PBIAJDOK_01013 [Barrientosiimonas humi]
MVFGGADRRRIERLERQLREQHRLLLAMAERLGVDPRELDDPFAPSRDVRRLVEEGQTIGAIKQHRQDTGVGLAEAKEAVEAYARSRGE